MQNSSKKYFDYAASASPNPSSQHGEGKAAREFLEKQRERCAAALGVKPETVFFTSGGTESNAIIIFSLLTKPSVSPCLRERKSETMLLYSAVEHPSIRENIPVLKRLGIGCDEIKVEGDGRASEKTLSAALEKNPQARMAAIMAVNNETGAANGIAALAAIIRKSGIPVHFHCDAVQAIGKIPVDLTEWDVDSASVSAHKLGGPRGIGLLYLRKEIAPLVRGGHRESGIRPGTENAAGAEALADCLEKYALHTKNTNETKSTKNGEELYIAAHARMNRLIELLKEIPGFTPIPEIRNSFIIPHPSVSPCLRESFSPYILQAAFKNRSGEFIPGEVLVRVLDEKGFAVSTGSACSSSDKKRPVLEAMGVDEKTAFAGIRISQGYETTADDIEALAAAIAEVCNIL
jgi:cysteine desulfurase